MMSPTSPAPRANLGSAQKNDQSLAHELENDEALIPPRRQAQERRFDQGKFAFHRGDYSGALREFTKASDIAWRIGDRERFVESTNFVLRILAEREEYSQIEPIEKKILEVLMTAQNQRQLSAALKSRTLYILGIYNIYNDNRHEQAMRRFRESIDVAILCDDKSTLASPLYGIANVHYAQRNFSESHRELDRLGILLSCLHLPDLESAAHLLRALVFRNQNLLDEALASAWKAFESLKHNPHLVLYMQTLIALSSIYVLKGESSLGRLYLDLADRSLKREEFPRIARLVDDTMKEMGSPRTAEADLIFDARTGILLARGKGEIRFEGQFILRDLLRVFLGEPGRTFTKEELVRSVWRETYDPKIHDNKIYVTIKRLRKLLEPETDKSDYILRAKNGYFLNPKTRVLISENGEENENSVPSTEKA